ncbi:MAG: CBS domain-containing protein [Planctomycetales bacterium]|nr:CBS domain-containing protein [Planctomycetales bacterium]
MTNSSSNNNQEFQDPLENYDPKTYGGRLEQALAEELVGEIEHEPYATIPPSMSVFDAVHKMAFMHVACLLVEEDSKLVGVFSDRDVLTRVALEYEHCKDSPVAEYMTTDPVFVYSSQSAAAALSVMAVSGHRHVPVLDNQQNIVGIVSPQRVTEFLKRSL